MKKLFVFTEDSAKILFLLGFAIYFLWREEMGMQFNGEVVILAFQFMLISSPLIIMATFIRWTRKWPTTVSWFTIALAITSAAGFVYSARALLFIFSDDNSLLLMKVILPTLVPILSAVAMWAALKWYHDRKRQLSVK